jgi:polar amino acid transport system ATP-binding protein
MMMDGGVIVELDTPAKIFGNPSQARTAEFLRRVIH